MPANFFQFKQFIIHQDKCAMKVTTDGCLFGSIVANHPYLQAPMRVLDIGAGTGLLSLMFAQNHPIAKVDAVELDQKAAEQASENVASSTWKDRIKIVHSDIQAFNPKDGYDVILSNPPFYEHQLMSGNAAKNLAHHSSSLTLGQLFSEAKRMLKPDGYFFILVPFYREMEAVEVARQQKWETAKLIRIKQTPTHHYFRSVILFGQRKSGEAPDAGEIIVKDGTGNYSDQFSKLLKPYYLHL